MRWHTEIAHGRVLVTGAGSGIGRAVAVELAQCGVRVFALGRRTDALEETARLAGPGDGVVPVTCDVRDPNALDDAIESASADGPVTALVHAAAQMTQQPARRMSPEDFASVVESTLLGTFNTVHRWAEPLFDTSGPKAAVLLTSNLAGKGTPGIAHSGAGKAGVESLVRSLGREWGPLGFTINAIGPGPFPVEKSAALWADSAVAARMRHQVALGRYGELPEIVGPIVFLLSEMSTFTTGQTIVVDGGMSLPQWPVPENEIEAGLGNQY